MPGGTSLDATLKEVRIDVIQSDRRAARRARRVAEKQAETRQKQAAAALAEALNNAPTEREALKAEGKLGDGEYEYWKRRSGGGTSLDTAVEPNSDYDGDGRRDAEDGGYDPGPRPEDN